MKLIHIPTLCTLAAIALGQAPLHATDKAKTKPADKPVTQALITGTAAGWRPMTKDDFVNVNCQDDTWSFEGNLIKCTGKPVGVIRTKKMIKNLELVVEWKHKQYGGNSGVFLWATPDSIKRLEEGKGRLPAGIEVQVLDLGYACLLYTSPSPRDATLSRMPSSA